MNSNYLDVFAIQFDFPRLDFSPLIRTDIECINKQLLVDVNWLNKATSKPPLSRAMKVMWDTIQKDMNTWTNQSILFKAILIFNFSKKLKILQDSCIYVKNCQVFVARKCCSMNETMNHTMLLKELKHCLYIRVRTLLLFLNLCQRP